MDKQKRSRACIDLLCVQARNAGNYPNDAKNGAKEQSGYVRSLAVRQLHDQAAVLEAVHHIPQMILSNYLCTFSIAADTTHMHRLYALLSSMKTRRPVCALKVAT